MSGFLDNVATASLPVAVGLLILSVIAGGVLWTGLEDEWAQRLARLYLEPVTTWCLIALGTYTVARLAGGDGGPLSVVLPLTLAFVAVLLRSIGESKEELVEVEPAVAPPAAPMVPVPTSSGNLWSRPQGEASPRHYTF